MPQLFDLGKALPSKSKQQPYTKATQRSRFEPGNQRSSGDNAADIDPGSHVRKRRAIPSRQRGPDIGSTLTERNNNDRTRRHAAKVFDQRRRVAFHRRKTWNINLLRWPSQFFRKL